MFKVRKPTKSQQSATVVYSARVFGHRRKHPGEVHQGVVVTRLTSLGSRIRPGKCTVFWAHSPVSTRRQMVCFLHVTITTWVLNVLENNNHTNLINKKNIHGHLRVLPKWCPQNIRPYWGAINLLSFNEAYLRLMNPLAGGYLWGLPLDVQLMAILWPGKWFLQPVDGIGCRIFRPKRRLQAPQTDDLWC